MKTKILLILSSAIIIAIGVFSVFDLYTSNTSSFLAQTPLGNFIRPFRTAAEFVSSMGAVGLDVDWAMSEGRGINDYKSTYPKKFKDIGVKHVRIRTMMEVPDTAYLNHLKMVVDDSLKAGLTPIIAFQADTFKNKPNDSNLAMEVNYWNKVATVFRSYNNQIAFDLMIEPTDALNQDSLWLNKYLKATKNAVRKISPFRIVFLTSRVRSDPANIKEIDTTLYTKDKYAAVQFHGYASGPSRTVARKLWTTGTTEEKKTFTNFIQPAIDFRKSSGVPIWFGAIMFGNYNEGDYYTIEEQINFGKFVNETLRKNKIPYAINSDRVFMDIESGNFKEDYLKVLKAVL